MGSSSRVGAARAYRDGLRRVNGALLLVAGMTLVTLLVALPLSITVRSSIETHLGPSLMGAAVAEGASHEWWQEFSARATGAAAAVGPAPLGAGAVLDNLDRLLENGTMPPAVVGVTASWLVVWAFLSGGLLDRLARDRPVRAHGFFAACGVHFWRILRLGLLALPAYALLFGWIHGWILVDAYEALTRDLTVERTAFAIRVAGYLFFGVLLLGVTAIFDFARVRIVVEDRRSAVGALIAGARFVSRHAGQVAGLYLAGLLAFLLLAAAYVLLSPGVPRAGSGVWVVLLLGQAYIVGRHYLKLVLYGAQVSLFQSALSHVSYTAHPVVAWPESPAAEAILNSRTAAPAP